ncbi:Retrovirus-related Pol polyprotein from transposon TNT 1-94 [Dendrobium catenatum]|uniref:Retrovirus-related Pol polyprotein from transposon TNT 1-94 n=1 Tax=Dendrobium catenatum TaxID=906689 RepID=A0A2I0WI85_9ASPA|nr:Retrovirus-related Pol polyprotein from transposon TNT 1-94 [Dendrobium catenatum]
MSTIKNVITIQLTPENHLTWKSQILKVFRANCFEGYLDGSTPCPPRQLSSTTGTLTTNTLYSTWMLIDQNLAAALFSTISAPLLPYVLNLESCSEIWQMIGKRLQLSNRSRILQIKNDLNFISMANKTMQQYLTEIKQKVDALTVAGYTLHSEDIIMNTLNGLPASYQGFKTAIPFVADSTETSISAFPGQSSDWVLDTGATSHITNDPNQLLTAHPYQGTQQIQVGNGQSIPIAHTGQGILPTPNRKLSLSPLLHVPQVSHNLLSVHRLTSDNDFIVSFTPHGYRIKDGKTKRSILSGSCRDGLYSIPTHSSSSPQAYIATVSSSAWHSRLGHPHPAVLSRIASSFPSLKISITSNVCHSCQTAKSHRLPFLSSNSQCTSPFQVVVSDVWGPSPIFSLNGYRYYVLFVDEFSHFSWLYPMVTKAEVFSKFLLFKAMVEKQFSTHIKIFRSDGGGEYTSIQFQLFLSTNGILHQFSCPHTPQQNGLAERKHRHIIETARTLLLQAKLPTSFWVESVLTAVYLINRLPSPITKYISPFQCLYKSPPSYSHLKIFGCLCYPWLQPAAPHKFAPKSSACVFIGYSSNDKGFRCYNLQTSKILISRHV